MATLWRPTPPTERDARREPTIGDMLHGTIGDWIEAVIILVVFLVVLRLIG